MLSLPVREVSSVRVFPLGRVAAASPTTVPLSIADNKCDGFGFTAAVWLFDCEEVNAEAPDAERPPRSHWEGPCLRRSLEATLSLFPWWCGSLSRCPAPGAAPIPHVPVTATLHHLPSHCLRFGRLLLSYGSEADPGVVMVVAECSVQLKDVAPTPRELALQGSWHCRALLSADLCQSAPLLVQAERGGTGREVSTPLPCMLVQVTRFACGGHAVAVRIAHALADVPSIACFVHHWSREYQAFVRDEEGRMSTPMSPATSSAISPTISPPVPPTMPLITPPTTSPAMSPPMSPTTSTSPTMSPTRSPTTSQSSLLLIPPTFAPQLLDRAAAGDIDAAEPAASLLPLALRLPLERWDRWASSVGCPPALQDQHVIPPAVHPTEVAALGAPIEWSDWDPTVSCDYYALHFAAEEVHRMRLEATTPSFRPSTLLALSTHLWRTICEARGQAGEEGEGTAAFVCNIGLRSRLPQPLPSTAVGSPVLEVTTTLPVSVVCSGQAADVAFAIHRTISAFNATTLPPLLHSFAFEDHPTRWCHGMWGRRHVALTSWQHSGLQEVQFVPGCTPRYVDAIFDDSTDGFFTVMEAAHGPGDLLVQLHLEPGTMSRLINTSTTHLRRFRHPITPSSHLSAPLSPTVGGSAL